MSVVFKRIEINIKRLILEADERVNYDALYHKYRKR